jgi:murein DD-endopeptidase MepM/ murein hydrolase activator NlpD
MVMIWQQWAHIFRLACILLSGLLVWACAPTKPAPIRDRSSNTPLPIPTKPTSPPVVTPPVAKVTPVPSSGVTSSSRAKESSSAKTNVQPITSRESARDLTREVPKEKESMKSDTGKTIAKADLKIDPKLESKTEPKLETKLDIKPEPKPEPRMESKVEAKNDAKVESRRENPAEPSFKIARPVSAPILENFNGTTNKGVSFGGKMGDPVTAVADGKVIYSDNKLRTYGNLVIVQHQNGYISVYGNNKVNLVKEGDAIKRGQKIAELGNSESTQVKLHFELRRDSKPIDPISYFE